jgi:DedD protein
VDDSLKKRLIGATVLVSLVVIFVPMLLEDEPIVSTELEDVVIPEQPVGDFSSKLLPLETEGLSQPLVEEPIPFQEDEGTEDVVTDKGEDVAVAQPEVATTQEQKPEPAQKPEPEQKPVTPKKDEDAPMVGISGWVIQVGSFSQRDNADKLVKELQGKKYAAFTDQVDLGGKILHRVLIGPEADKARAEKMLVDLNKLLAAKKLAGKIKRYQ